jgi:UDP-N-acetylglucosamine 2-epimerase (non-hydrolysing)
MKINEKSQYYFFIGTEAELIKLFPVLLEFEKRKINYKIVASGQNNIGQSELLKYLKSQKIGIVLFNGKIKQTAPGLFFWFISTLIKSLFQLKKEFTNVSKENTFLVIHGDTISTVMGALLGRRFGLQIAHVEAGLRSYNYLHPFPEEIDRVIASRFASIHFCPNQWAVNNLKSKKGTKINTFQNTLFDSLYLVVNDKKPSKILNQIKREKFFIFIMHRQENLFNDNLVKTLISEISTNAKKIKCLFIIHKSSLFALEKKGIIQELSNNKNIILTERLGYVEFMKVLDKSEYIITDGGSNQEETYYMGKPCLILREHTERIEGLNKNVILSKNNVKVIREFIRNYKKYKTKPITAKEKPSKIIADYLTNN